MEYGYGRECGEVSRERGGGGRGYESWEEGKGGRAEEGPVAR